MSDSFHPLWDYSSLPDESFSGLLEPALETSLLVANEDSNVAQILGSGVKEINDKYLWNTKDTGYLKQSKEYSSQPLPLDKMDSQYVQEAKLTT